MGSEPAQPEVGGTRGAGLVAPSGGLIIKAAVATAVAAIVLIATFMRQTGVPKAHTIWAEDGVVFAACAYSQGLVECLRAPYHGYLHTVARLSADVAVLGDPVDLPLHLTLVAALVAAGAAIIVAFVVYDLSGSAMAAFIAGAALALVWPAAAEVSGNLTNLHWILLAASIVVMAGTWLGRPPGIVGLALLVTTVLSSPIAPFLLPLLAVVSVVIRAPGAKTMTVVVWVTAALQLALLFRSARASRLAVPSIDDVISWATRSIHDWGWFGNGQTVANLLVVVVVIGVVVALGAGRRYREATVVAFLGAIGLLVFGLSIVSNQGISPRYIYTFSALAAVGIALGLGLLTQRMSPAAGRGLLLVALLLLGVGAVDTFKARTYATAGPDVVEQIAACDPAQEGAVDVLISPVTETGHWHLRVPCRAR